MAELFEAVVSWPTLLAVLLVFGVAPGLVLRLIVLLYPKDHPRRKELVAELYVLPHWERPLFVAEQLEVGLTEAVPVRAKAVRVRRAVLMRSVDELNRRRLNRVRFGMSVTLGWLTLSAATALTGVTGAEPDPVWLVCTAVMAGVWLTDLVVVRRRPPIRIARRDLQATVASRKQ